ncbi:MAG TPA: hypothetical protein VEB63_02765 [Chitinophagaceae bacterium]|nr:hypothetical protein [Chitinophagaceae bacterium]
MLKAIFTIVCLAFLTTACNNEKTSGSFQDQLREKTKTEKKKTADEEVPQRPLVGRWKPVDARGENLSEADKEEIYRTAEVEFTEGGRYIAVSSRETEYGKYRLETGNETLILEKDDGTAKSFRLEWVSRSKVVLVSEEGSVTIERQ